MKLLDILVTVLSSVFLFIIILTTILLKKKRNNKIHNKIEEEIQNKIEEEKKWIEIVLNYEEFTREINKEETNKKYISLIKKLFNFSPKININIEDFYKKIFGMNDNLLGQDEGDDNFKLGTYLNIKHSIIKIINDFKKLIKQNKNITIDEVILKEIERVEPINYENSLDNYLKTTANPKNRNRYHYINGYQPLYDIAKKEVLKEQQKPTIGGFIKFIKKINNKNKQTRKSKNIKSKKTNKK